jgi:hypothetical protein
VVGGGVAFALRADPDDASRVAFDPFGGLDPGNSTRRVVSVSSSVSSSEEDSERVTTVGSLTDWVATRP